LVDNYSLVKSIKLSLEDYGPADAIFMVENEIERFKYDPNSIREIYRIADSIISDRDIGRALAMSLDELNQADRMMHYGSNMDLDEWMLIITIISSCYCTNVFSLRRGCTPQEERLASSIEKLRSFTSGFRNNDFQRALSSARRHNPNPLPHPLQYNV
jgi:hypothetical protein